MSTASEAPKKRTRRRLRVSCVECTRRRQKCDREQPCGLCRSRGVEHLCRWELEPFARPSPARPPGAQKTAANAPSSKGSRSAAKTYSNTDAASRRSVSPSASPASTASLTTINSVAHEVKEAAIALAQLSVARHGEFLGTGSLVCALHRLDDSAGPQIPTDKSSGPPFCTSNPYTSDISNTFTSSLQNLILGFPDKPRCDQLIAQFFEHENWHYGLPQTLIFNSYKGMWDTIQADLTSLIRIDFHWVTLLFSIFAISPACTSEEESRKYFLQALAGKRLADDLLCASFVSPRVPELFTQGTAHGCIAAALIAEYMSERGQMTEAWKLIGSALRNAQNCGLHLNPAWTKWKDMNEDEKTLRGLAWHLCAQKDKFLSFVLGRPVMIHARDTDVPLSTVFPTSLASDGSTNTNIIYQACMSSMLDAVSEEKNRYLSVHHDTDDGGAKFDAIMEKWEGSLPNYFACRQPDTSSDHLYPHLRAQRCVIAGYFSACRMLFHRSLACVLPPPSERLDGSVAGQLSDFVCDYDKLTGLAINLLQAQKNVLAAVKWRRQICLSLSFLVFEAAITLTISLLRDADNQRAEEWRKERDTAVELLEAAQKRDHGYIVRQALLVLRVLQDSKPGQADRIPKRAGCSTTSISTDPRVEGAGLSWLPPDPISSATATSTLPPEFFQSLDIPQEWMTDNFYGTVTAFDLLQSL